MSSFLGYKLSLWGYFGLAFIQSVVFKMSLALTAVFDEMVNKADFLKFFKLYLDHQDSEFSSENEDDFPTKSTAKTTIKKTGNSSKPEVAKSSISAFGIFDDQDQKFDSDEGNSLEGISKKTVKKGRSICLLIFMFSSS